MPDAYLDAKKIRAGTFIRHAEIHDTLGSTNDRAAELARDPHIELPALVAARLQTAGRGRGKNTWWSADGALTFSVLLDPAAVGIAVASFPQLSLTSAVAVCDALASEVHPQSEVQNPKSTRLAIKWPNDVVLDDAKVCGILIESPGGAAPAKDRLIIGIGINVNNCSATTGAISLCEVTGTPHNLQQLLCDTLNALDARAKQLATNDFRLPSTWQKVCWLKGRTVEGSVSGKAIGGNCVGIDANGALMIEDSSGTHRIRSGSVSVL